MPLYLTNFSYTPETWDRLIGKPEDRRTAAQSYIESSAETTVLLTVDETLDALRRTQQVQYQAPGT